MACLRWADHIHLALPAARMRMLAEPLSCAVFLLNIYEHELFTNKQKCDIMTIDLRRATRKG